MKERMTHKPHIEVDSMNKLRHWEESQFSLWMQLISDYEDIDNKNGLAFKRRKEGREGGRNVEKKKGSEGKQRKIQGWQHILLVPAFRRKKQAEADL